MKISAVTKDLNEYTARAVLRGMIFNSQNQINWLENKISDTTGRLKEILENFTGNEVDDDKLQRVTEYARNLEKQVFEHEEIIEAAKANYYEITGENYVEPKKASKSQQTETYAKQEALDFLANREKKSA